MFRTFALASLLAASLAGSAAAQPDPEHAVRIKVTPADLQTPDAERRLAFRLRVAASRVCNAEVPAAYDVCRRNALRRAYEDLHSPAMARALGVGVEQLAQVEH